MHAGVKLKLSDVQLSCVQLNCEKLAVQFNFERIMKRKLYHRFWLKMAFNIEPGVFCFLIGNTHFDIFIGAGAHTFHFL